MSPPLSAGKLLGPELRQMFIYFSQKGIDGFKTGHGPMYFRKFPSLMEYLYRKMSTRAMLSTCRIGVVFSA